MYSVSPFTHSNGNDPERQLKGSLHLQLMIGAYEINRKQNVA